MSQVMIVKPFEPLVKLKWVCTEQHCPWDLRGVGGLSEQAAQMLHDAEVGPHANRPETMRKSLNEWQGEVS